MRLCAACAVIAALFAAASHAQEPYPTRAVRLVIPYAPGGGTDVMARRFAMKLGPALGRQLIPDNKGGAGGSMGTAEVARAAPDGYTLLVGVSSTLAINPWAMLNPPYDAEKDFTPVVIMGTVPMTIVVHPSVGTSLKQLIARARTMPGKLSYGSAGVGSINHLTAELFKKEAGGLDIVHVPYKGSGPAVNELIAGEIPMIAATFSAMVGHHRSGKARMLAVTAEKRSQAAPEIPTAVEQGLPGMVAATWQGLLAPAGTPKSVIDILYKASRAVLNDSAFHKELEALAIEPVTDSTPESAARFIQKERAKWGPIVKATGFKME
jgi:tripartite-type tricarboxylate transporter receptor subunit TctC